jgi:hypothetical protein
MNAKQAIERSVSHNEIVTLDHDSEALDALESESEGSADNTAYGVHEFWGTTDAGDEWRVHVRCGEGAGDDLTPPEGEVVTPPSRADLAREVGRIVGDDGTGDIRVIVDHALAADASATAEDIAAIVREARSDAAAEESE